MKKTHWEESNLTGRTFEELGIHGEIEKVTEIDGIEKHGVMMTPALLVDGSVNTAGKASA